MPELVPIEIYQGEDWTAQIVWTDDFDEPQQVIAPCRMDIKDNTGQLLVTLETPEEDLPEGEIPTISLSTDIGMVQLHLEDSVTAAFLPGLYKYDLFLTVNDGGAYAGNQQIPLLYGPVTVSKRTTVM
jgi:hypothetical protein